MKRFTYLVTGGLALAVAATGVLFSPLARSATQAASPALPAASTVFQDWNAAFLVQGGSGPYYATTLKSVGTTTSGTWVDALDIAVAEDAYEHGHLPAEWELVKNLVTVFLQANGTDWASYDGWNDDLGWMINATLRGYLATGNKAWLNVAATQWNDAWNRGWTMDGGGGVWENSTHFSKCSVSNGPMVFNGVSLYRITGDKSYLAKAEEDYAWMKANLVDSSGQVNDCIAFPNGTSGSTELQAADLQYDAGVFIDDGDVLYRATGNKQYADDAALSISHWENTYPIVASTWGAGWQMQYWLFKGVYDYCTDTGTCGQYNTWMRNNAAAAWSERDSHGVTWNNWSSQTQDNGLDEFETSSMPALFEQLPVTAASPFHGYYHLRNADSGKLMSVQHDSKAANAGIIQETSAKDPSAAWSLVRESNGYYAIRNARSGMLVNVEAASGALNAKLRQWPAQGIRQGNDQWYPVHNANRTWSFYNRNSQLALSIYRTAAGTQLVQEPQSNKPAQQFALIPAKG